MGDTGGDHPLLQAVFDALVYDHTDPERIAPKVQTGILVRQQQTLMKTRQDKIALAEAVLELGAELLAKKK